MNRKIKMKSVAEESVKGNVKKQVNTTKKMSISKIHYSWVMCFAGTLLIFITMGSITNGFTIYMPYIMESFNLTHAQTSTILTARCLTSFVSMIFISQFYRLFSIRTGVTIAASFAGIAFVLYSFADSFWDFAIASGISGLAYGLGSMIPISILINNWFDEHKALALGICSAGSGVGYALLPPITNKLLLVLSMEKVFMLEAIFIFICVAIIYILIRNTPEEKGIGKLCASTKKLDNENVAEATNQGKENVKNVTVLIIFLLTAASFLNGAGAYPGVSHLPVLYTSENFTAMFAATVLSLIGITLTIGKIIFGDITDKIGGFKSCMIFYGFLIGGSIMCCFAFLQNPTISIISALILGLGYPIATMAPSIWANDLATGDDYEKIIKMGQVAYQAGGLVIQSLPGIIADHYNGSYIPAYVLFAIVLTLSMICSIFAYGSAKKMKRN